MIVIITA